MKDNREKLMFWFKILAVILALSMIAGIILGPWGF